LANLQEDFSNKVVLVTGGSSGIGKTTAIAFARAGAKVAVASRNLDRCKDTVCEIQDCGGAAIAVQMDVSQAAEVEQAIQIVVDTYGRLDCAFNNAGTLGNMGALADLSEADFDEVI
jgi:NAD(P)-dependent dehydrogenase (short-subunit alcohol dehydrogenase family)